MLDKSIFTDPKERKDFIIAIFVILFFLWLFLFSGFLSKKKIKDVVPLATSETYDTDKDGLSDVDDQCPTLYANTPTGCPLDTDQDGVPDIEDECPEEAGLARLDGCPADSDAAFVDSDGDGIADNEDECPDQTGTTPTGCPSDLDKDGIFDADDKCPEQYGVTKLDGCPEEPIVDTDGDGIADEFDKCPGEAGSPEFNGCATMQDQDGDGVADDEDKCPIVKGSQENDGCPNDKDNDGVADEDDRCPEEAGAKENEGCPELELSEEDQTIITEAVKNVQFATGSARLTKSSENNLNQLAGLMEKYPKANLSISGYTDNQGNDESNLELSKARAKSCANYLETRGVNAFRISSEGYGEANPVASNDSAEGRKENRRVEFELNY